MFFGFDDTWRWRYRNDEEHFDRFWIQTVRVLSRSRVRRVELKVVPKTDFRRDEKITVVVRFPVEAPAPPAGQPVRVTLARGPLTNDDGSSGIGPTEVTTLTLARVPGPGVEFATTLTRTPRRVPLHSRPEPPAGRRRRPRWPCAPAERGAASSWNKSDLAAAARSRTAVLHAATADKVSTTEEPPARAAEPAMPAGRTVEPPGGLPADRSAAGGRVALRKRERLL